MSIDDDRQKRIERMQRIRAKVVEWAAQHQADTLEAAVRCWLGGRTPSKDKVKEAFLFALIAPPKNEPSILERFRQQADTLSRFEREMFEIWANVQFSVFEITDVNEGVSIEMQDRISGTSHKIREKTASKTIQVGDWLAAFIKEVNGQPELEGTVAPLHGDARQAAMDALHQARTQLGLDETTSTPELTRQCAQPVIAAIRQAEQT